MVDKKIKIPLPPKFIVLKKHIKNIKYKNKETRPEYETRHFNCISFKNSGVYTLKKKIYIFDWNYSISIKSDKFYNMDSKAPVKTYFGDFDYCFTFFINCKYRIVYLYLDFNISFWFFFYRYIYVYFHYKFRLLSIKYFIYKDWYSFIIINKFLSKNFFSSYIYLNFFFF